MNEFSNEMNEIYKLAGVQINEEQGYFTDWKSIRDKTIKMYIRSRLEETGVLEDDDWYVQKWLEENASPEMLEELYNECGTEDIYWVASYINKNADEGGIVSKVAYNVAGVYFDQIANQIQKEFEKNNLIYRMIDSDKSPKEIAQILKTNGTGNCWAKQEENAKSYYGNGNYNEYCLIGEATMDNVNWESTIYLRMMAEYENEVRLKKDSPIHIIGIKFYHYNEDNALDKQDHMKVDLNLSVGHTYVFSESVKPLNKNDNDDTKLVTSPYELNQILINNNEMRVIYDKEKKWYIIGNPETSIHYDMLRDAMVDGLYTMNDGFGRMMDGTKYEDGQNYYREHKDDFVIFRTTSDINNDEDFIYDDYRYSYEYKDYCVFDRNNDFPQTTLYQILGKPIAVNYFGSEEDELDESIAYASKNDLSDIILKNPTRKELKDNNLVQCRCMEDSEGNWYFADIENMLHCYMVTALRDEAYFPLFDGNDCYGIAYYDAKSNEFWYNLNDYMYKKECIEQYKNSEYLRTTFPNARIIPNPWNNQGYDELYDDEEQLDEEVAYEGRLIGDTILKNPTRKELREWDLMNCRVVLDWNTNDFYFGDAYINIHDDIIGKVNAGENDSLYYDCYDNTFYKRDEYRNENEKMYMERSLSQWLSSFEYIKNTFVGFNAKICMEEEPFESVKITGNQLNEEIIHAEKSNYDDYMAVVLKNPTRRELRDNGLEHSRFICFKNNTWLFFDSMQWIHENILNNYAPKFGNGVSGGFYDNRSNTFIFVESYDSEEDTEEFDEETKYYEEKSKDWLLNNQYILNTFGANLKVKIIGDWVDSPW